jgi:hypothetical protein
MMDKVQKPRNSLLFTIVTTLQKLLELFQFSAVTNTLVAIVSESRTLNDSKRCLLYRPTDGYNRPSGQEKSGPHVKAGSNTSTVALRVVGAAKREVSNLKL